MTTKWMAGAAGLALSFGAQAFTLLSEGFDNVPGLPANGWAFANNSTTPVGPNWFQGNTAVFTANAGPADSYAASAFTATNTSAGAVSNWLLTPVVLLDNSGELSFFLRNAGDGFLDRLEIRMSTNGASTNVGATTTSVGDFTTVLGIFQSSTTPGGWINLSFPLYGVDTPVSGRLAFRHVASNVSINGNYVGIDDVVLTSAIPEPGSMLMMALGVAGLLALRRRG